MGIVILFLIFIIMSFCYWIGKAIDTYRNIVRPDNTHKNRYRQIGFVLGLLIVCGDVPIRYAQFYYLTEIKRYPPLEIDEEKGYVNWGIGTGCDVKCQEALFSGQHEIIEIDVQNYQSEHLAKSDGSHLFYLSDAQDEKCFKYSDIQAVKNGQCIKHKKVDTLEYRDETDVIVLQVINYHNIIFPYAAKIFISLDFKTKSFRSKLRSVSMEGWWLPRLGFYYSGRMSKYIDVKHIEQNQKGID